MGGLCNCHLVIVISIQIARLITEQRKEEEDWLSASPIFQLLGKPGAGSIHCCSGVEDLGFGRKEEPVPHSIQA